jgi:hypothetical protein
LGRPGIGGADAAVSDGFGGETGETTGRSGAEAFDATDDAGVARRIVSGSTGTLAAETCLSDFAGTFATSGCFSGFAGTFVAGAGLSGFAGTFATVGCLSGFAGTLAAGACLMTANCKGWADFHTAKIRPTITNSAQKKVSQGTFRDSGSGGA